MSWIKLIILVLIVSFSTFLAYIGQYDKATYLLCIVILNTQNK